MTIQELDWSGRECPTLDDLAGVPKQRGVTGSTHCRIRRHTPPPSFVRVGRKSLPLINRDSRVDVLTWRLGLQRAVAARDRDATPPFSAFWRNDEHGVVDEGVRVVDVDHPGVVDCRAMVQRFPNVAELRSGRHEITLVNPRALSAVELRSVWLTLAEPDDAHVFLDPAMRLDEVVLAGLEPGIRRQLASRWTAEDGVYVDLRSRRRAAGTSTLRQFDALADWPHRTTLIPDGAVTEVAAAFDAALARLRSGTPPAPTAERLVERLNAVNAQYHCIETDERDELRSAVEELPRVAGRHDTVPIAALLAVVDQYREW